MITDTNTFLHVEGAETVTELFDIEAEKALVGSVIFNPDIWPEVKDVKPPEFYLHKHQWIWSTFVKLQEQKKPIDIVIVTDALDKKGKLKEIGGAAYLTVLINQGQSSYNSKEYAGIVQDFAERRRRVQDANRIANEAYDLTKPLPDSKARPLRKTRWKIGELLSTAFPEPTGPIPRLIPVGLTVFGGRPKRGKSWLMLQGSYSVAVGGNFLNHVLAKNHVLYFALEDSPRRLKDRLAKFNPDPSAWIEFEQELKPLHLGGLEQIEKAADDHYLIVIDTLGRSMPGKDFTKDGALFADMLGRLQTIALAKNIAIAVIMHTRKQTNGIEHDPVDDIMGSTGIAGAPDCVIALYKEQGRAGALLKGRCRDFDEIDLTIEFDPITCAWQLIGDTNQIRITDEEAEILEAMSDLGKAKVSTIAKAIGKDRSNTSNRCGNLWTKGSIRKELIDGVTYYYLPTQDTHTTQSTQDTLLV